MEVVDAMKRPFCRAKDHLDYSALLGSVFEASWKLESIA